MSSPFEILGVDADADEAAVVDAYRRRVKETHPDQGGSMAEFQAVQEAYERIRDGDPTPESAARTGVERDASARRQPTRARVEYVDYEAVVDHGWAVDDDDLFENAAVAGLDAAGYGRFIVEPGETLLEAAENRGFAWPYACRGGACANCAVAVLEGELSQPVDHILSEELVDENIRLSCNGLPLTDELRVVYNVKHLPRLEDLRLPPDRFERAYSES